MQVGHNARMAKELRPEQTMVFTIEDSLVFMIGAFDAMATLVGNQEKVQPAFGRDWSARASMGPYRTVIALRRQLGRRRQSRARYLPIAFCT
jgi:hypothetical protein